MCPQPLTADWGPGSRPGQHAARIVLQSPARAALQPSWSPPAARDPLQIGPPDCSATGRSTVWAASEGVEIGTVEGVADRDKLHVIQEEFLEHAALQCGICTPGLIVSTKALLEENPEPTEEEARYYLAGNLCRCTGYDKIIRAVMDSAEVMRGDAQP